MRVLRFRGKWLRDSGPGGAGVRVTGFSLFFEGGG